MLEKYFQYGKSYLIYGHNFLDSISIVNRMLASIADQYNEIFYFDASDHSIGIKLENKGQNICTWQKRV